jgi:hypothetical protein
LQLVILLNHYLFPTAIDVLLEYLIEFEGEPMSSTNSYVYINDDEVELKQIIIRYGNLKKMRKFTISEAEKRGLVKVESGPHALSGDKFSKEIAILDKEVRLCLSTKKMEF